jgi:predicted metalloprotease
MASYIYSNLVLFSNITLIYNIGILYRVQDCGVIRKLEHENVDYKISLGLKGKQ